MGEEQDSGGFLPPAPGGPDLDDTRPSQPGRGPQSPAAGPQSPAAGPQSPAAGAQAPPPPPGQYAPPPPPGQYAPPPLPGPPPASPYQQPWAQQQPYGGQPVYARPPRDPNDPGNAPAIIALVLGIVSLGLLFVSIGFSSLLSLGLGIGGIVLGVNARRRVREGVTTQHGDLGTAGFAISIGATVLSAIATLFWGGLIVAGSTSDFTTDTLVPFGAVLHGAAAAGHTLATLLG